MTKQQRACVAVVAALVLLPGCASREQPPTDPQIVVCQDQARGARPPGFDQSKTAVLTAQADAFASCLEQNGYVFDEAAMDKQLTHDEQVWNSNLLRGEIDTYLARRRQELRLTPSLWRPGPAA